MSWKIWCMPKRYKNDQVLKILQIICSNLWDKKRDYKNHRRLISFFVRHCQNLRIFSYVNGF
jgi:hypothetical protein